MHHQLMHPERSAHISSTDEFAAVMKMEFAGANLECQCREKVDEIVDKAMDRVHREEQNFSLSLARAMRDRISGYLTLLSELDDLTADEKDLSCFHEIAGLFEDIGAAAAEGARAAHAAAGDAYSGR